MSAEKDWMLLGGGTPWRKELPNISKAKSQLPLRHLCNIAPLVLLEFDPKTAAETVDWLLGKVTEAESLGGADLLGRVIGQTKSGGAVVVIGAPLERLLLEADEHLLFRRKPYCCSHLLHHSASDTCNSTPAHHPGDTGLCCMLSSAEAVNLVQRILGQLKVGDEKDVHGVQVVPGEQVINSLCRHGVITELYPLHHAPQLDHLRQTWGAIWGGIKPFSQTNQRHLLEEIKGYFGEAVAHYFEFLESLISALILKSLLAVLVYNIPLWQSWGLIFFTFSNMIWSGLFLHRWKQRSQRLEADWEGPKTWQSDSWPSGSTGLREALPQQQGDNKVSSRFQQSMLFLASMFFLSSVVILVYFQLDAVFGDRPHKKQFSTAMQILDYLPEISLTMAMEGLDHIALWFSHSPNANQYQRFLQPLLPEVVIITIYNHFAVYVYRALFQKELIPLCHHLTVQLATQTALRLLTRGLLPYLQRKWTRYLLNHSKLERQPPILKHIQDQSCRTSRNLFQTQGYLHILLAYCHVMLFSGVFPQGALWCLLGAVAQFHLDLWQMCTFYRRPFLQATSGLKHAWHHVFDNAEVVFRGINAVQLWTSSDFQLLLVDLSQWDVLKVMVGLQLLLMGLKTAVMSVASRIFSSSDPQGQLPQKRHLRRYRLHHR